MLYFFLSTVKLYITMKGQKALSSGVYLEYWAFTAVRSVFR